MSHNDNEALCEAVAEALYEHFGEAAFLLRPEQADEFLRELGLNISRNCFSLN